MFIGEAPGRDEDEQGRPFVGAAGRKLSELAKRADFDLRQVYVTNVVKCRPIDGQRNRAPSGHEIKSCSVHLMLQIKLVKPDVLVCLGNSSLQYFIPKAKILSVHGQILRTRKGLKIFPLIHPAAVLRNPEYADLIVADLQRLNQLDLRDEIVFGPTILKEA